jgi:hypothetical protein
VKEQAYVVLLALSFATLAGLHLVLLMNLRVRRVFKIATIAAMSFLYVATFYWVQGLLGWSAAIAVPERFKLIAARVIEPDLRHKRDGAIHIWVEELDDRNIPSGVPRAYLLPYSPQLASKVSEADAEVKKGNPQAGTANIFNSSFGSQPEGVSVRAKLGGAAAGGDPSGGGVLAPSVLGGQSNSINLIPLPPPMLPPKDDP